MFSTIQEERGLVPRILICLAVGLLVPLVLAPNVSPAQDGAPARNGGVPAVPRFERAAVLPFDGMIDGLLEQSLMRRLDDAKSQEVDLLILEINSPGGLAGVSFDIAEHLQSIDWAHVVAYVPEQAISGAAVVSLGCDEILPQPGARIGDVGVIFFGQDSQFRFAEQKVVSEVALMMRQLAEKSGRPPTLCEAMVDKNLVVFKVRNRTTQQIEYLSKAEIDEQGGEARWEVLHPVRETAEDRFLTVSGEKAVELGLADATVRDLDQVLKRYGVVRPPLRLEQTWTDTMVAILNKPFVTGLLFVAGIVCLYMELQAPGLGIFAGLGAICFGVFFWSKFLGGTAGWLEVILFIAGVTCILMELFVIPGFGISGFMGVALLVTSLFMASTRGLIPTSTADLRDVTETMGVMVVSGIVSVGCIWMISKHFGSLPVFRGLMVGPDPEPEKDAEEQTLFEQLIGQVGSASSHLRPFGKAQFGDLLYDVTADGEFIEAGTNVEVIDVQGNRVIVRRV